jgi:hypothetical protein
MNNDGIWNEYNGGFGNEDNGLFGNEDNDHDMFNEYILEDTRLENTIGDDDEEVSVSAGPYWGEEGEAVPVHVANEAVVVAVMDEAVWPPLLPYEPVDANIVFPTDGGGVPNDDDVP